jgi:hypothetical protein
MARNINLLGAFVVIVLLAVSYAYIGGTFTGLQIASSHAVNESLRGLRFDAKSPEQCKNMSGFWQEIPYGVDGSSQVFSVCLQANLPLCYSGNRFFECWNKDDCEKADGVWCDRGPDFSNYTSGVRFVCFPEATVVKYKIYCKGDKFIPPGKTLFYNKPGGKPGSSLEPLLEEKQENISASAPGTPPVAKGPTAPNASVNGTSSLLINQTENANQTSNPAANQTENQNASKPEIGQAFHAPSSSPVAPGNSAEQNKPASGPSPTENQVSPITPPVNSTQ